MTPPAMDASRLTAEDLAAHPVWRFITPEDTAVPGADESWVMAQSAPPRVGEHASYLVAASYTLQGGAQLPGIVQVDVLGDQVECDPCVILAGGKSVEPLGRDAARRLERLLKRPDTQPVRWRLGVLLVGETTAREQAIGKPGAAQVLGLLFKLARLKRSR